jgi:hypothetical protein
MPDTRLHRGAHPEDATLFARENWPLLRRAASELWWLLDHGYAARSSLELVGNRHALTQRQRLALARAACSQAQRDERRAREMPVGALAGQELWIDGYNLLISLESALSGGIVLGARDGCYRDLASLHGTYRSVNETEPALRLIGDALASWRVARCHWLLDRPVSNSGRLQSMFLEMAVRAGWAWTVALEFSPDRVLAASDRIVVTSDSAVLDRCSQWVNLARALIASRVPTAWVFDLNGPAP